MVTIELFVEVRDSVGEYGSPLPFWMTASMGAENSCTDDIPKSRREISSVEIAPQVRISRKGIQLGIY